MCSDLVGYTDANVQEELLPPSKGQESVQAAHSSPVLVHMYSTVQHHA